MTSSLIKLYIEEPYSNVIADMVRVAEIVATCRVAYTEVMSALNIRLKKGDLSKESSEKILERFKEDWQSFAKVDFDDFEAGKLIGKYGITRFGALHLSAAKLILDEYKQSITSEEIKENHSALVLFFSSVDKDLCKAATVEGLKVLSSF